MRTINSKRSSTVHPVQVTVKLIDADINGSANIMKKAFLNTFTEGVEEIVPPVRGTL